MKNLRHRILLFATTLLCVVATATAETKPDEPAKSPRLLYQEGLFAELTEGDLEKAIEIYEQVVAEASKIQRLAAQATYQLGICYLKKGEKEKAAEYFQGVVDYYPKQKTLVEKALKQLSKLPASSTESLTLGPAPWVDGEVMETRLKRLGSVEYGTVIYSAQSNTLDGQDTWQIISHLYVSEGSLSQYTFVEADVASFVPVYGQTTNWMGDFSAKYQKGNVTLTVSAESENSTRDVAVPGIAYDNEQALYLVRRMPLSKNYEGRFPIFAVQGGAIVECRIKVLGLEEVTVEAGTFKCYKTDLAIYAEGAKTLQHTLWFSADKHKYLVKYDVGGTATIELAKVWQKKKNKPLTFKSEKSDFSVTIPADWRFYRYGTGPRSSLQLIPPEAKAWAALIWQKRGTDPDSASAMTIAKSDFKRMKGSFENYIADQTRWKEFEISGLNMTAL